MDWQNEFEALLADEIDQTDAQMLAVQSDVALYMAQRAAHLSTITHEPGFGQAVRAEANNVALMAGIEVSQVARAVDHRLFGIIVGALHVAAAALAG